MGTQRRGSLEPISELRAVFGVPTSELATQAFRIFRNREVFHKLNRVDPNDIHVIREAEMRELLAPGMSGLYYSNVSWEVNTHRAVERAMTALGENDFLREICTRQINGYIMGSIGECVIAQLRSHSAIDSHVRLRLAHLNQTRPSI